MSSKALSASLVLVLAATLAACGESPASQSAGAPASEPASAGPSPASPASEASEPSPSEAPSGLDLDALTQGVSELSSYQLDISMTSAGQRQLMTIMATASPPATHYQMATGLEVISIEGQGAWFNQGGTWTEAPAQIDTFLNMFDAMAPDTIISGLGLAAFEDRLQPEGTEERNGVEATHYHLDADDIPEAEQVENFPEDASFDIWVATEGEYLVAVVWSGTDVQTGTTIEYTLDVSRVNDPTLVIEAPI